MKNILFSKINILLAIFLLVFTACKSEPSQVKDKKDKPAVVKPVSKPKDKTSKTPKWKNLFKKSDFAKYKYWKYNKGIISHATKKGQPRQHLFSNKMYTDFELKLEWKAAKSANSGIFIRVLSKNTKQIYASAIEMQILDNKNHYSGKNPVNAAGAVYDLYPTDIPGYKGPNEWNQVYIKVVGSKHLFKFNGKVVKEFDVNSPEYKTRLKKSKFRRHPNFGTNKKGYIMIQDHGDTTIEIRNLKIREL